MKKTYEPSNPLSMPFECFVYESKRNHFPVEDHWHYFAEMLYVKSGTLLITLGKDSVYDVHPGEAFLICPNVSHAFSGDAKEKIVYNVIKMDLNRLGDAPTCAPNIKSMLSDARQSGQPMLFGKEDVHSLGIDTLFEKCIAECREQVFGYDLLIRAILYEIMTNMIRIWMKKGFTVRCENYQSDLFSSMDSITAYIDKHIRDGIRVEHLAELCGMSYSGFSKKFRELYGITCKDYIIKVRIAKAEHYLRYTGEDLTYISQETGYADCSHMIKEFKHQKGVTPAQYRKKCRGSASSSDAGEN